MRCEPLQTRRRLQHAFSWPVAGTPPLARAYHDCFREGALRFRQLRAAVVALLLLRDADNTATDTSISAASRARASEAAEGTDAANSHNHQGRTSFPIISLTSRSRSRQAVTSLLTATLIPVCSSSRWRRRRRFKQRPRSKPARSGSGHTRCPCVRCGIRSMHSRCGSAESSARTTSAHVPPRARARRQTATNLNKLAHPLPPSRRRCRSCCEKSPASRGVSRPWLGVSEAALAARLCQTSRQPRARAAHCGTDTRRQTSLDGV
jgi:hypothetical protein